MNSQNVLRAVATTERMFNKRQLYFRLQESKSTVNYSEGKNVIYCH